MRILVTGGLGTVGGGIVKEMRRRGHEVWSLDLSHQHDQLAFSLRNDMESPRYVRCDIAEFRQLERVFESCGPFDYVYNCAAEFGRWNGEDYYEQLWRTNAVGTKNVIRLQERLGFRLIHFSSSEVYGDWPGLMVETVPDEYAIRQMNDYAMTKWANEMQVRNSMEMFGTESVVIRLFNTYGPGEFYAPYRSVNCRFIYCALHGLPWVVYRGHQRTSTYLPDTVNSLCNIPDNFKPGEVYNIGGDAMHTIEELSDAVLEATGADPALVSYKDSEILTTKVKKLDPTKCVRDLGHANSYSLREGIRLTAEWMAGVYGVTLPDQATAGA
ncbi:NAD-dependent epimerase/dehydratase family protein [Desulfohalovibrio reitneri]|uniref:NAD-dependent epimerase/dehydratase family protein n=1 Tax=Desulfohalovibrio reitneri TaxID=1307759 RepID=UPI0004A7741A|nr:NAD(P)-dependent oxidoreductase [Desulfohalovibrio reitneri]